MSLKCVESLKLKMKLIINVPSTGYTRTESRPVDKNTARHRFCYYENGNYYVIHVT